MAGAKPQRLVFTGANLVDGDRPPQPGTSVVVEEGRIARVAPDGTLERRPGERVIALAGRTLMPGMFSCHFHTTFAGLGQRPAPVLGLERPPALMALVAAHNVKTALAHGFTTLVCSSSAYEIDIALKQAVLQGFLEGPRLFACTREMLTPGDEADGLNQSWFMELHNLGLVRRLSGPEAFREAVREELGRGADIAKVAASGGHGTSPAEEHESLSREELRAAVEAAHGRGKRIRAHAASRRAILECAHLGVDLIDHADRMDGECLDAILESGSCVAPTLLFSQRYLERMELLENQEEAPFASAFAMTDEERAARLRGAREDFENICRMLPQANRAGVKLVVGDDFGTALLPHGDYVKELELYVKEIGIPPLDVIRWATLHGAEVVGLGDALGTVAEGKRADLLVVDGDPTEDIACLRADRLLAILQEGRFAKDILPKDSLA